jgi:ribonuclease HI
MITSGFSFWYTVSMITIFTDGSSLGNPGAGGWGAIVQAGSQVAEYGGREDNTTNNRMEMMAVIASLESLQDTAESIAVYTDSKYLIQGITAWVKGWQQNGWKTKNKTDVLNKDLWQKLVTVVEGKEIKWNHVDGHQGIPGNERVDRIAVSFAENKPVSLYNGPKDAYTIDLSITISQTGGIKRTSSGSKKAFSYISMVDGVIQTHETWAECEARVKGKKARFKKALSKEEEEQIIALWTKS